jgi:hypothetical protein
MNPCEKKALRDCGAYKLNLGNKSGHISLFTVKWKLSGGLAVSDGLFPVF